MARDFESFIVDPDLLDPSIDATNLRTTTDTRQELLSDVPEFSGIEFDPTQKNYVSDLYALYSGQLPSVPAPAVTASNINIPLPGGGGSGGGGQTTATTTAPITAPATTPTSGGITNVNTPLTQMITNPVTGQTQTVKQAMTSNQAYTTPTSTSSQAPYGTNPTTGQPYQTPRTIADQNAVLGQTFNNQQDPSFWENAKNNFIQTGEDIGGFFANLGNQGLDIGKLAGTTILNLAGKALTGVPLLGTAASLIGGALPPRDPRQTALEELYDVKDGTIQSGLMQGYNPVSGNPLDPTFGLQDAYDDRIDTIENTLKDKYNMTAAEIADVKAGSYTGDVDTDLLDRLNQLEEAKTKEKARLDLFSGDIQETGDASIAEQIAEADRLGISGNIGVEGEDPDRFTTTTPTGVNPFADIDTGVGEFDTAPVTGVTQPGTGTVLGKEGIDRFDDAETNINMFQDATTPDLELENQYEDEDRFTGGTTVLGQPGIGLFDDAETGIELNPYDPSERTSIVDRAKEIGLGDVKTHLANNSKLEKAAQAGIIDKELYNELGGYDVTQNITGGSEIPSAALNAIVGTGRNISQAILGEQDFAGIPATTIDNTQGALGFISQDKKNIHNAIINGDPYTDEGVAAIKNQIEMSRYQDPIMGMVNQNILADDTINRMTDDVDLDLFDTTPQDMPTSTFDADTFDDDVSFNDFDDLDDGGGGGGINIPSTFDPSLEEAMFAEAAAREQEEAAAREPTPAPSPPTGTSRPGGDRRDDSPAPSPSAPDASGTEGEDQDRFSGGGVRDSGSTPSPSPTTSQGVTTSQFQAFRDSGSTPSPSRPSSPAPSGPTYGPHGGGGGGGGGGGSSGGCFLADTLITMADGSTKEVQKVDLGDNVAEGGKVFATGKFLIENLHDYKGIKVSGSHMVNEDDNWVRVENSKHGKSLGDDEHTVYVFGSENRRILINDILFTDYFETTEQKKLIDNEKDFFNNWKQYSKEHNESNVNILNAS